MATAGIDQTAIHVEDVECEVDETVPAKETRDEKKSGKQACKQPNVLSRDSSDDSESDEQVIERI